MPGPAPKHPSVRARKNQPKKDFRSLPADGRGGPAPAWPLQPDVQMTASLEFTRDRIASAQAEFEESEDGRTRGRLRREINKLELASAVLALQIEQATDAEVSLWNDLWATPQAVMWEESHSLRIVALYVRCQIRAEQGDLKSAPEARQLSDRLGLNDLALLRLRAEVERLDDLAERGKRRRSKPEPKPGKGDDPRGGLFAVS